MAQFLPCRSADSYSGPSTYGSTAHRYIPTGVLYLYTHTGRSVMVSLVTVPATAAGCLQYKANVFGDTKKWTSGVYIQVIIRKEHLTCRNAEFRCGASSLSTVTVCGLDERVHVLAD